MIRLPVLKKHWGLNKLKPIDYMKMPDVLLPAFFYIACTYNKIITVNSIIVIIQVNSI